MFRIEAGRTPAFCDGLSRRSFVQVGVAGMAAVGLPELLRAKELSAAAGQSAKDTAVILIWLNGGPSHIDTYDMKPNAPAEFRGLWRPIRTNVPGIEISELMPRQAKVADKFSIVRSLAHNDGDHFRASHWMVTGRKGAKTDMTGEYPSIGAIAAKVCGARQPGLPPFAAVPFAETVGQRPGYFAGNYLGREFDPFQIGNDPNRPNFKVDNFSLPKGMTLARLENRRGLREQFDHLRRVADTSGTIDAMDRFERQAFEFISGPAAQRAFDIGSEPAAIRDRYGRNTWGQSTLLARRLVEAGSTFVTVCVGSWDHHGNIRDGLESQLPKVDTLLAALFQDLADRGLYERTLVVMCGEFGRTPRMNKGSGGGTSPGRDHWGNAMFCLLGGGGVQGGRVIGATNRLAEVPISRPVSPQDIHATIYQVLGVDPHIQFLNRSGRPVAAVDNGQAISELF